MSYLYLIINIGVLLGPLALSFDKRVAFFKSWKAFFFAMLIMMAIYIPWDMIFTHQGVWGFNEVYLSGLTMGNLPIEEVLFFVTVPYACTFIYACVSHYFQLNISDIGRKVIIGLTILVFCMVLYLGHDQYYSFYTALCSLLTLVFFALTIKSTRFWAQFFVSYLIAMIPFLLVNGILTGTGIEDQVVWYNSEHIFNVRILTIPIEDSIYNFGMLLLTIGSFELIVKRSRSISAKN